MPGPFAERQVELRLKQQLLLERSGALRARFAQSAQGLESSFAVVDRARSGIGWLLAHPWWIAAGVALPLVLRPLRGSRALGWATRLWTGWRFWRRAKSLLKF